MLPAATLAAAAFAASAHAEDEAPSPALPEVVHVDQSVAGLVVTVSQGGDMPVAPALDVAEPNEGSAETVPAEGLESPANVEASGWVLVDPAQQSSAPAPQAAVISTPELAPVVARAPPVETRVRRASPAKTARQYQPLRTQYHRVFAAAARVKAVAPHLRELAIERTGSIVSSDDAITARNDRWNCVDERNPGAAICAGVAGDNLIRNCRWIPECTADLSQDETLPPPFEPDDDMAVEGPESEDTDEQYQPEDEQYQSEPEDPDSESGDEDGIEPGEDEPVSGSCDFDDVDHGSVVPVGGPSVEPPSGLDSGVTQPAPPTAPEFPSPTAPGVGPQGLTGAEPSIGSPEAVPVDERPAAETARPPRDNSADAERAPITIQNGAGRLLGESTDHDAALGRRGVGRQPISSQPRGKDVKAKRTLSRPRADVLASRETGSGGGATAGAGRWLLVFAMLLFAVALLGLAYAGLAASPEHLLLRTLASRVRSKGLSRSSTDVVRTPADRGGEKPTGIRYRD